MIHAILHLSAGRAFSRVRAAASAVLAACVCVIIAGCAGGGSSAASGTSAAAGAGVPASLPRAAAQAPHSLPAGQQLASLLRGSQSIIWTATVTLRSRDVSSAAALAGQLATAHLGYVASESTDINPGHPGRSTVDLTLKVPVSAFQATLTALSSGRFGTQLSLTRRAQDVTQAVADIGSRVASARAAIAQLRALLAKAGSVGDLLDVQDQIDQEESSLEALQAQQRALSGQVAYATVSVLLEGKAVVHHRKPATGFLAGLAAGWRAFMQVVAWLLTGLGAALPFLIVAVIACFGGYRVWRWRARPRPAPPASGAPGTAG